MFNQDFRIYFTVLFVVIHHLKIVFPEELLPKYETILVFCIVGSLIGLIKQVAKVYSISSHGQIFLNESWHDELVVLGELPVRIIFISYKLDQWKNKIG